MDKNITFYSTLFHEEMNDVQLRVFHMLMNNYSGVLCQKTPIVFNTRNIDDVVIITKDLLFCGFLKHFKQRSDDILFAADFNQYRLDTCPNEYTPQDPQTPCDKLCDFMVESLKLGLYDEAHTPEEYFDKNFK